MQGSYTIFFKKQLMNRKFILLFLGIAISNCCLSQTKRVQWNFGPELGIAISQFPDSYDTKTDIDDAKTTINPLVSPLAGVHVQAIYKKFFLFTTGLQYEMSGNMYRFNNDGYDTLNQGAFTAEIKENQTFHKICLPLSIGITFDFLKQHFSVYGGWRPNFFISGKYYKETRMNHSINSIDDTTIVEFNPLHKDECAKGIKHFNNQLYCGISFSRKRLEFAVNCNIGAKISYSFLPEYQIKNYIKFRNNDFTVSLRYRFYAFSNHKTHCNLFDRL